MTHVTITRIDGDPQVLLDGYGQTAEVMDGVGRDHDLIVHLAAATDDGLLIINVWPSAQRSDEAAGDSRRLSVVAGHHLQPEQVRKEHLEAARLVLFARARTRDGGFEHGPIVVRS